MTTATIHCVASQETLSANLAALARRSARAVARIAQSPEAPTAAFFESTDGAAITGTIDGRALASKRRPLEEAEQLAESIDLRGSGTVVLLGFGLGHHAAAIANRMGRDSLLVIFEPDLALLRSVLERIDHTSWLSDHNVVLLTDPAAAPEIMEATAGLEALISLGVEFVEHPPSKSRLGSTGNQFSETFARVVASMRTHVITTMVQSDVTLRNLLMNVDHYVTGGGVHDLQNAAAGFPAIVVSAGPSLRRNIEQLKTPGLRDRCVIIAVQTVLKQLLAHGIKPHFVTALDYHEISRRFYEGLTASDVEDITLVAEPKANPAILESFPGAIRLVESDHLQTILGDDLAPQHGTIRPGATVAHLAYYLARHLGCDPVMLIGQDLAFTDGQYYQKNAAIHDTWAGELNPFNTLEMMEWQRIVRWRGHLSKVKDILGRDVYSDDQMQTYLAQFERDFYQDAQRGLTIIDATEGGVRKAHTHIMPLAEAIAQFTTRNSGAKLQLPTTEPWADRASESSLLSQVRSRISTLERETRRIERSSRDAQRLLEKMLNTQSDVRKTNDLIERVYRLRDEVEKLQPAYGLVHRLNQTGAFKRFRADRDIRLTDDLSPQERQRRQIERDIMNVSWLADVAELLATMFRQTTDMLDGGPRFTRESLSSPRAESKSRSAPAKSTARIIGAIPLDPLFISEDQWDSDSSIESLAKTLDQLSQMKELSRVVLLGPRASAIAQKLEQRFTDGRRANSRALKFITDPSKKNSPGALTICAHACDPLSPHQRKSIVAARLLSESCWRGSLGNLTIFDELLRPSPMAAIARTNEADGLLLLGPNWPHLNPHICDELIARFCEDPSANSITFTQAIPGAAGCIISKALLEELEQGRRENQVFATFGGVLGYLPVRPRTDPIARDCCVQVPAELRTPGARRIQDSRAFAETQPAHPQHIILELTPRRLAHPFGPRDVSRAPIDSQRAIELIQRCAEQWPSAAITLGGFGDPLLHDQFDAILNALQLAPFRGIHLRTDLLCDQQLATSLLSRGIDILSIDIHANSEHTYRAVTGFDGFRTVITNLEALITARKVEGGLPFPWIVPRITRRDAVYDEIELAYDKWLLLAGAAAIDQLPEPIPGDRIEPLGKPRSVARHDWQTRLFILSDGNVMADERNWRGERAITNILNAAPQEAWRALIDHRTKISANHGEDHPDLWTGW